MGDQLSPLHRSTASSFAVVTMANQHRPATSRLENPIAASATAVRCKAWMLLPSTSITLRSRRRRGRRHRSWCCWCCRCSSSDAWSFAIASGTEAKDPSCQAAALCSGRCSCHRAFHLQLDSLLWLSNLGSRRLFRLMHPARVASFVDEQDQ